MQFFQSVLLPDGRPNASVDSTGQKTIMGQRRWVDVFNAGGLPAVLESDMPLWLRCHVPVCVAFESVSVAGQRRGDGASWREAITLARGVRASFGLIKGLGYELYPNTKRCIAGSPTSLVAAVLWTMSRIRSFRELLATGENECNAWRMPWWPPRRIRGRRSSSQMFGQ